MPKTDLEKELREKMLRVQVLARGIRMVLVLRLRSSPGPEAHRSAPESAEELMTHLNGFAMVLWVILGRGKKKKGNVAFFSCKDGFPERMKDRNRHPLPSDENKG